MSSTSQVSSSSNGLVSFDLHTDRNHGGGRTGRVHDRSHVVKLELSSSDSESESDSESSSEASLPDGPTLPRKVLLFF